MKKTFYSLMIIASAMTMSCGASNKDKAAESEAEATEMTEANAEAGETNEANAEDGNVKPDQFVTFDLAFFDLRGHVKSMTEDGETHEFTENGELIGEVNVRGGDYNPYGWERNDDGHIFTTGNGHVLYKYIPGPKVGSLLFGHMGDGWEEEYIYNHDGLRIGHKHWVCDYDEDKYEYVKNPESKETVMYSDIVYDDHMNWTSLSAGEKKRVREIVYY